MLSPPAATVEMMGKGKGGKGKNWTSWPREVGTRQYLKNFRKGLRFQRWRAWCDVEAAPDDAKSVAQDRFLWVLAKQKSLDYGHEMVKGGPVMQQGGQMQFADLMKTAARRCLTKAEIRWNAAFIEQEAEEQRRGSASAATPATRAPDTPPRRTKRGDDVAAPMHVDPSPPRGRSRPPPPPTPAKVTPKRTSEAERERLAHNQALQARCSAKRSATARFSKEETTHRSRGQRNMAEIQSRALAREVATTTRDALARRESIALLHGSEAAEAMKSKQRARRLHVMSEGPSEAAPLFHHDWTIVAGSKSDPLKLELELRLRSTTNKLIR